jgi:hypothetical protein
MQVRAKGRENGSRRKDGLGGVEPCNLVTAQSALQFWSWYRVGAKGGKQTLVGTYNNTYRIDVTNP